MHRRIDMRKAAVSAIVANALQIVAVALLAVMLYHNPAELDMHELRLVILVCAVTVCWGAFMDIGAALTSLRIRRHEDELRETCGRMEELNRTLRAQRHDFMNHIQVIYSLIEMNEPQEACDYMDRVYGDIQRVNRALRTDSVAVNALLQAKLADCERRGIRMELDIRGRCAVCWAISSTTPSTPCATPRRRCSSSPCAKTSRPVALRSRTTAPPSLCKLSRTSSCPASPPSAPARVWACSSCAVSCTNTAAISPCTARRARRSSPALCRIKKRKMWKNGLRMQWNARIQR